MTHNYLDNQLECFKLFFAVFHYHMAQLLEKPIDMIVLIVRINGN